MTVTPFGDRLAAAVADRSSQIVVGIDPDPASPWPGSTSLVDHCLALVDAAAPACVAAKPQLAFFELFGAEGWDALSAVVERAHEHGLLVLADGKRGDVPNTAKAYADALLGTLGVDAFTANPLLGGDSLAPFVGRARVAGGGVIVLVRTSNPGAAELFDLELAEGGTLWERIAGMVAAFGSGGIGPESGLSDVLAVTGATFPEHLARMRELMPHTPFLLPGIGAQGGDVDALGPAFAIGHAGGLITASRSIANAYEVHGGDPASAARKEAERLREAAWALV